MDVSRYTDVLDADRVEVRQYNGQWAVCPRGPASGHRLRYQLDPRTRCVLVVDADETAVHHAGTVVCTLGPSDWRRI